MTEPLLPASLLARLERLQVANRRRLAGGIGGEHRSPRHGSSLDFADFRDYYPGDDLRRLDRSALARFDRLLIKLFDAEDDLTLRLLVDNSASMAGQKLQRAVELAAALGFAALVRRDVVTVHTFSDPRPGQRLRGRAATGALFARLGAIAAEGETRFSAAADHVLRQQGPPGMTVVLSDLLTPEWDDGLTRLPARNGELVVVHVLAPEDLDPALSGDVELVDAETGARVEVSLSASVLDDYRRLARRWQDDVAGRVRAVGGRHVSVLTTDDVEQIVLGRARDAGVLR
ncbi:MAG: DUF58 domain-containing protein [Actinomycetota bacterium]